MVAAAVFGDVWSSRELHAEASSAEVVVRDSFPAHLEALKDEVVDKIIGCESGGLTEDDGVIVFDSNHKASIGLVQFQQSTVIQYEWVLYGELVTKKQAIAIALDKDLSRQLAKDVIFKVDGGIWNWAVCAKATGVVPEIEVIKRLSK